MGILANIETQVAQGRKLLAYLIDPDKYQGERLDIAIDLIHDTKPDLVFVGGSLVSAEITATVKSLKQFIQQPVILYPGSVAQFTPQADAILFISLISGRNPEFLIGNHVVSAPLIRQSGMEVLPTGYMLIDGGNTTSVQYMSNTMPIPCEKSDIAVATAMAGEYLGLRMIYMDAGSGAHQPVPPPMIRKVKSAISVPLMIGGGLNTPAKVEAACQAGADLIVIGNAAEKDPSLLMAFKKVIDGFNKE
jgi:putative glycerol-1-phosphate prenyltransferase